MDSKKQSIATRRDCNCNTLNRNYIGWLKLCLTHQHRRIMRTTCKLCFLCGLMSTCKSLVMLSHYPISMVSYQTSSSVSHWFQGNYLLIKKLFTWTFLMLTAIQDWFSAGMADWRQIPNACFWSINTLPSLHIWHNTNKPKYNFHRSAEGWRTIPVIWLMEKFIVDFSDTLHHHPDMYPQFQQNLTKGKSSSSDRRISYSF